MILSVVVISFNQLTGLRRLVADLAVQDFDRSTYEIIVVDDGSTDGSREWILTQDPAAVRHVFGQTDRGRAASRNSGIRAATGDIVVMLDGDHSIQRDFLAIHAQRHQRERCAIVGKSDFADSARLRALNAYLNGGGASKLPSNVPLPGRYFLTRNCSVPRDVLVAIGLFDETFVGWGGEDLDLGVRLVKSGLPIYGEPRAAAIHHHHRSLDSLLRQVYEYGYRGIPRLISVHSELFRELKLDLVMKDTHGSAGYGICARALCRLLMAEPVFQLMRLFAHGFGRFRVPRAVFDYLHWRQYSRGFLAYRKAKSAEGHGWQR